MVNKVNRAKQFMPFDALKGFKELIKEKEESSAPKLELLDDDYFILSEQINAIKKGDGVEIMYYNKNNYSKIIGIISNVNYFERTLSINNTKIKLDDILFIKM